MKKLFALAFIFLLLLCGCNNQDISDTASGNSGTSAAASTDINGSNVSGLEAAPAETDTDEDAPSSSENTRNADGVVKITENLFIAQTNDIYINTEDYLGKTIQYEGIFDFYYLEETDATYYYVIRYGPGCCGYDGTAGFEVIWDGDYPEQNDWVEAVGVLETYEEDGVPYLRLQLTSLTVLDERGAEYVAT